MSRRRFPFWLAAALLVGPVGCVAEGDSVDTAVAALKHCSAEQGQSFIDDGRYADAVREFSCVIDAAPTEVEGYRGRIEAELLLGRYADAVSDYARVTALVEPVHPDAASTIYAGYSARLAAAPQDIPALTGASFARWWYFQYGQAIQLADQLLAVAPADLYGNLFRGSSRVLLSAAPEGFADLEHALELAPQSADVRYVVADAYTYGQPDLARALAEATLALEGGIDTPRVHAIIAGAELSFGNLPVAASHLATHLDLVTSELFATQPLAAGSSVSLALVPYRTYELPIAATAGQTISIKTGSPGRTIWDSIAVLLAPDGTPVTGSDDAQQYYAAFDYVAGVSGTYRLRVSSFEAVSTGTLVVTRN